MSDLTIDLMTAAVTDWPDPEAVRPMLERVAQVRLDDALRGAPLPEGEWCVRRLDVAVSLDPERPSSALESTWADQVLAALHRSLSAGSPEVLHYRRPEDAVDDALAGLASGVTAHAWAWTQMGLARPGDPSPSRDPRGLFLTLLERLARGRAAALARVVEQVGGVRAHRLLGAEGWERAAELVLSESGRPVLSPSLELPGSDRHGIAGSSGRAGPGAGDDARADVAAARQPAAGHRSAPGADPAASAAQDDGHSAADAHAQTVLAASALAMALLRSGLRVGPATLENWATLALGEAEPSLLRRPDPELAALIAALVRRLRGTVSPGRDSMAARAVGRTWPKGGARDHGGSDAAPGARDDAPADQPPVEPPGEPTRWGGLLFLLNTAEDAGVPEALASPPLSDRGATWALHRIGMLLAEASPEDPAVLALAGTQEVPVGDTDDATEAALAQCSARWALATRDRMRLHGDTGENGGTEPDVLARIVRRDAVILRRPGWTEAVLAIEDVDLGVRRAGLDIDPGWMAWLGQVVKFRYE
ncbi:hypothetical protein [Demequina mangrovi]|uniref:Uncharacterized protein n=1 Tax=Demequina mangrovi TaxID=1043493 RepID=A0A1H6TYV7_9MICO|nr:hypothetical protein [Demequina mangrovi]SEI82437.1 hypothetical protein SAMN05421637_0111 [Demequina mangrovi]